MKKITILALHLSYGGVEKAITNMANMFVDTYEVEIVCTYCLPNTPVYPLDERVKVSYLMKDTPNRKAFKESVRQRQWVNVLKEGIKALKILFNKKYLLIKKIRSIDDGILISTRNEDSVLVSKYASKKVYTIAQLHHDHCFKKQYIRDFQKKYKNIDVFALLNNQLCEEVQQMMEGYTKTSCIVIPNFIDNIPLEVDVHKKEAICLAVGRLDPIKGFDRLIKMAAQIVERYPDWKFEIVGDGEQEEELKALIKQYHLESHVLLLGRKNSEEIQELMKKATIFCMTSYNEGFGIVLVEAMSCKAASVAFDVRAGPASIIDDEKNGFLVTSEQEFIKKVEDLIENKDLCISIGEEAYQKAKMFSRQEVQQIWYRVLEQADTKERGL